MQERDGRDVERSHIGRIGHVTVEIDPFFLNLSRTEIQGACMGELSKIREGRRDIQRAS